MIRELINMFLIGLPIVLVVALGVAVIYASVSLYDRSRRTGKIAILVTVLFMSCMLMGWAMVQ